MAITGKGGVGKTAVTAMLVRVLAHRGRRVLACDFDVNPGLDISLGPLEGDGRLPREAVAERDDGQYGFALREDLTPRAAVERFAAVGPDGLRLLSLGSIGAADHDLAQTHYAVRQVAAGFDEPGWDVVVDMEAGTKDVFDGGYVGFVDVILAVTDSQPIAELVCRRLTGIAAGQPGPPVGVLSNRTTPPRLAAAERLAEQLGVPMVGAVPQDEQVRRADVEGVPVVDYAGFEVPAVRAVEALIEPLEAHCGPAGDAAGAGDVGAPG